MTGWASRSRTVCGSRPRSSPSSGSTPAKRPSRCSQVHAEDEARHELLRALRHLRRDPLVGVDDDARDLLAGELRRDHRDVLERRCGTGGEGRGTVVGAVRGDDDGGRLGGVFACGPRDRSVGGDGDDARLPPRPCQPGQAVRVEAVAQGCPRDPRFGQQSLGRGVDACGDEGAVVSRALVARVQDASDAGGPGRVDRRAMQAHGVGARVVRRHEEQLVRALEGTRERARIRVVPAADADPSLGEPLGLGHVADGDGDLVGGKPCRGGGRRSRR